LLLFLLRLFWDAADFGMVERTQFDVCGLEIADFVQYSWKFV
jgi:hypothetical protein